MQKRTERNEEIINKEAQLTLYIYIYIEVKIRTELKCRF